jgi:hypothetical protein
LTVATAARGRPGQDKDRHKHDHASNRALTVEIGAFRSLRKAVWNPAQRSCSAAAHMLPTVPVLYGPCTSRLALCRPTQRVQYWYCTGCGSGQTVNHGLHESAAYCSGLPLPSAISPLTRRSHLSPVRMGAARKPVVLLSGQRKSRLASWSEI